MKRHTKTNGKAHSNGAKTTSPASQRQHFAARFNAAIQKTVAGYVEAGRILIEAKEGLPHGQFLAMVREDLCFGRRSPRMCQMLMKIARHPVIAKAKFVSHLPPSWGSLYDLATQFSEHQLLDFIRQGLVHPALKRHEIAELEDRLITSGNDGALQYLFARIGPLMHYPAEFPDVQEAVERLWAIRRDMTFRSKPPARGEPSFGGTTLQDLDELCALGEWLAKFHAAWKRKLQENDRDGDDDDQTPAFVAERRRQQKDEQQEEEVRLLAAADERALGLEYDHTDYDEAYDEEDGDAPFFSVPYDVDGHKDD